MAMTHHYSSYSSAVDCRTWWLNSPLIAPDGISELTVAN